MNQPLTLLAAQPLLAVHVAGALAAVAIGAVLLWGRKGSVEHRVLGWAWVVAMAAAALSSIGLGGGGIPHIAGFSPIHLLTLLVLVSLPLGVMHARRHRVTAHRKTMTSIYIGGCIVAGLFNAAARPAAGRRPLRLTRATLPPDSHTGA
ncbi:MAG: DUF2306 domain-containing protein [Betaproteobacteria bacterium]|nr:DUF2306 domain-containing protein [Betaproteobacteria bacterium]